jgi:N-acyl-L-homoserine lactone synthetase
MDTTPLADSIAIVRDEISIALADSPRLVRAAHRLRYQVYCVERGFEAGHNGLEIDEFDCRSRHVVLQQRRTGQILGTVRLVLPLRESLHDSFPVQRLCDETVLPQIPLLTTAEVSRFAISKYRNGMSPAAVPLMRLGLVQGIMRLSSELGLTHWLAVMERSLLRLLQSTAIHFQPFGPLVEHHGTRQPAYVNLCTMLSRMSREQPLIWDFLTDGGKLPLTRPDYLLAA